jgi:phosphoglycerate dehydrogenase-like enzyme
VPKRVLITWPIGGEEKLAKLRSISPDLEIVTATTDDEALEKIGDAEGLFGWAKPELVRAGKKLRWIQVPSAGVENCMFPELTESDITLTNAQGIYGIQLGDHVMAFILAFSRCLNLLFARQQEGIWESRDNLTSHELLGTTLLVVGLGGAGTETAKRAKAFGMHIIGLDLVEKPMPDCVDEFHSVEALDEQLPRADYVAVCCPLTHRTRKLFGAAQFARMKPTAYFVTVARGGSVDTDALVAALEKGRIAGAGLDVTDPEPLPEGHPLWSMANCIITPHCSGQSPGASGRLYGILCENLKRFAAGKPLLNVVDKREGF